MVIEPVPGEPAAVVDLPSERALVIAEYHAGLEVELRQDGVELRSHADERRAAVLDLLDRTRAERLIVLGDLANAIGNPASTERTELEQLLSMVTERVPVTVVKGNHDGEIESVLNDYEPNCTVTPSHGLRRGNVGFVHGHTWPSPNVLAADVICMGHEHPTVRLEDEVGGSRVERVWLRGRIDPAPFQAFHDEPIDIDCGGSTSDDCDDTNANANANDNDNANNNSDSDELVIFPAFNDRTGGTWINVDGQSFLSPFLPEGLIDGQAYLLDGTRLGNYHRI